MSIRDYLRPDLRRMSGYHDEGNHPSNMARMHANESPWPAPFDNQSLHHYPDPQPERLCALMANHYGVPRDQLMVGRGSDDLIDLLIRACCVPRQDNLIITPPTFVMYSVYAKLQQAQVISVPLSLPDFEADIAAIIHAIDDQTRLVFACTPNNPTGGTLTQSQLNQLAEATQGRALLVVDEAYAEFLDDPPGLALLRQYEHIVCLRTLSKAHALAGARMGVLMARAELVAMLRAVMAPYPLSPLATQQCEQAFTDDALAATQTRVMHLHNERERMKLALMSCQVVQHIWPSHTNFLLLRVQDAKATHAALMAAGFWTRSFGGNSVLHNCLRISVGTEAQNNQLLQLMTDLT